ncbi:O-methyltransferase [Rhodococcus sp. ANT_H53B]|uniref:O-methyltransferase n=1 Tax=Rhodococcus sp. ANT_H53B TaxID=2597357 RepID=UPI0011F04964|nr:O-methyltransferase [Rhodococcus sp. ANT_H53B]KAA0922679.1 hypothetical protein FQ188_21080 [Rhodococcus sp. ANT_H53B]
MSSTNAVNFALRPSKSIEREVVFEATRALMSLFEVEPQFYLGFGSVWFADFHLAIRYFALNRLISIEMDEIAFKRAQYNKPYRHVEVHEGESAVVVPELLRGGLEDQAGIFWLDFDSEIDEDKVNELTNLVQQAGDGSVVLATFNVVPGSYSPPRERIKALREIFGDAFIEPEPVANADRSAKVWYNDHDAFAKVVIESTVRLLASAASAGGKGGGTIPVVSLLYKDSALMATVGVMVLSAAQRSRVDESLVRSLTPQQITKILAPILTHKEVLALRQLLPSNKAMTRSVVQRLGFDLSEEQIEGFEEHFLRYPLFLQASIM